MSCSASIVGPISIAGVLFDFDTCSSRQTPVVTKTGTGWVISEDPRPVH